MTTNNSAFFAGTQATDGWADDTNETWTYVSATSFKISGVDLSAKYTVGTRIKLTQTTVKYFVVAAVSFSTDTTVTITAGTDYTLANAAISANFHSYQANPQGYPDWFTFAPAASGFSGTPTVNAARFRVTGRLCDVYMDITGTSNATTFGCTLPIAPIRSNVIAGATITDNGTGQSSPGSSFASASTAFSFFRAWNSGGTAWTNSGTKACRTAPLFSYEI